MEPPLAVDVGQVLLEDDVLEHVLGHRRAAVDEAAETVVDDENLGVGETKKMAVCSCDRNVICIALFKSCTSRPWRKEKKTSSMLN